MRIDTLYQLNDFFYMAGIEIILYRVIIGGRCDHYKVSIAVGFFAIQCGCQVQLFFSQIFLDVFVLDGGFALIDQIYFFRYDIYCRHLMVLAQQGGNAQPDIACSGHCNFIILH